MDTALSVSGRELKKQGNFRNEQGFSSRTESGTATAWIANDRSEFPYYGRPSIRKKENENVFATSTDKARGYYRKKATERLRKGDQERNEEEISN